MNTKYFDILSKAITNFWAENDIYIMLLALSLFAAFGFAHLCLHYKEWLFNLIEEDNERTYYLNTSRRNEP